MKKSKVGRPKKAAKEVKNRKTVRVSDVDLRFLKSRGYSGIQQFIDHHIKVEKEHHEET